MKNIITSKLNYYKILYYTLYTIISITANKIRRRALSLYFVDNFRIE